jgi:hypothetical protein
MEMLLLNICHPAWARTLVLYAPVNYIMRGEFLSRPITEKEGMKTGACGRRAMWMLCWGRRSGGVEKRGDDDFIPQSRMILAKRGPIIPSGVARKLLTSSQDPISTHNYRLR